MNWNSYPTDETVNGMSRLFNFLRNCQTFPYSLTYNPLILRYLLERNERTCPLKDRYTNVCSSLFIRAANCNKPKCPWAGEYHSCCIHAMQYDSAIKRNESLIYIMTWMHLKIIVLSERRQTHSHTNKKCRLYDSITQNPNKCKLIYSDRKQIRSCMGMG